MSGFTPRKITPNLRSTISRLRALGDIVTRFDLDLNIALPPPPGHVRPERPAAAADATAGIAFFLGMSFFPAAPLIGDTKNIRTALGLGFAGANEPQRYDDAQSIIDQAMDLLAGPLDSNSLPVIQGRFPLVLCDVVNRLLVTNPQATGEMYLLNENNLSWTPRRALVERIRELVPVVRAEVLDGATEAEKADPRVMEVLSEARLFVDMMEVHKSLVNKRRRGHRWCVASSMIQNEAIILMLRKEDADLMVCRSYETVWQAPTAAEVAAEAAERGAEKAAQKREARKAKELRQKTMKAARRVATEQEAAAAAEQAAEVQALVLQIRELRRAGVDEDAALAQLMLVQHPEVKHEVLQAPLPQEDEDGDSCPVCLDRFAVGMDIRMLTCGHKGCAPCFDRWVLAAGRRAACPLCRGAMTAA
jgi:hypothetical protein